ncbi:hypothetical protein A2466_02545 [Candidatus Falkowbacteria bacterium RIFOXYC2_FULL_34_220]|nr:MAG: hypothetical protein A2500_03975 [Candidatus Falkowbacteria bacterium RIFOXYC12_FULL_34_55]OGF37154.1 MAG: hypothetical protein A2466_02545 [Candidatus Falkowbacteria bacterium RIFOXYC2_FULL_34_220]
MNFMTNKYNHQKIEKKWAERWVKDKVFSPDLKKSENPYYALFMFPYPSAEGLHIGNFYAFTCVDVMAKYKKLQGMDVFEPVGFDAFGIHSENYALKIGETPRKMLDRTIVNFRKQLSSAGLGCDWTREIDTTTPEYYKWTQWIFTKLFEKDLAYQKEALLNWCSGCKTVLADEQIEDGVCERCKTVPEKKTMKQWFFRITKYAEKLLNGLETMDWSDITKSAQRNWIGRSEGAEVEFVIKNERNDIKKIYLGTGNKSKIERLEKIFKYVNPDIKIEQVPEVVDVPEESDNGLENSKQKVLAYHGKYDYPVVSCDTSVFFEGEDFDPTHVKRVALGGEDESGFSQREIAEKIKDFYIDIARKYGGRKEFYFEDAWTILFPNGEIKQLKYRREYIMTDKLQGELDIYFPMRSLYLVKATGRDIFNQTEEEWKKEFQPQIDAFSGVFGKSKLKVFTTRPDTLFGATYFVMSPEHPLVREITTKEQSEKIEDYIKKSGAKSELERTENKEKTGEFTGAYVVNPVNNEEIPVFVADYVMMGYGTGAIMAVPAHDERDFEFAKKFNISIKEVVKPKNSGKDKTILVLHGLCDDSSKHWFPWFKQEFGGRGYNVIIPDMPNPHLPRVERWMDCLKELKDDLSGNLTIVGFSLGTQAACMFIDKYNVAVNNLILVGPSEKEGKTIEELVEAGLPRESLEHSEKFGEERVDWKNVRRLVKNTIQYLSSNDPYIEIETEKYSDVLNPQKRIFFNRGHFTEKFGIDKILELIPDIEGCTVGDGIAVNSGFLDGLETSTAKEKMISWLEGKKIGKGVVNYRLRDWCISRQRYWGPPVPIVYCAKCGALAVFEKDLPVRLPELEKGWEPVGDGRGPLANVDDFMNTTCPKCGGAASREADVMDNFLDSAWYFFRYIDPKNNNKIFDQKLGKKWLPVDFYVGGNEHAVLHLMYTRFITMALHDIDLIDFDNPFKKFRANGMILKDGKKMSKSKGNVINPEEYGEKVGYDALKTYLLFLGPLNEDRSFTDEGVRGTKRWVEKIARLEEKIKNSHKDENEIINKLHKTIKMVTDDFEDQRYNTAVARLMELTNVLNLADKISTQTWKSFLVLVSPFVPSIAEEMWERLGNKNSIFSDKLWPEYDAKLAHDEFIELIVQVNGKLREKIEVSIDITEEEAKKIALESGKIKKWIEGKKIEKVIFVKGKLINIVVK